MAEPMILALSCADRPGIVARVTGYLAQMGGNIIDLHRRILFASTLCQGAEAAMLSGDKENAADFARRFRAFWPLADEDLYMFERIRATERWLQTGVAEPVTTFWSIWPASALSGPVLCNRAISMHSANCSR